MSLDAARADTAASAAGTRFHAGSSEPTSDHHSAPYIRDAETILNSARDAFVAMDSGGRITAWNDAAEAMFGYARDEAIGRSMVELIVPPGLRVAHTSSVERFVETHVPQLTGIYGDYDAQHRDGHTFPVEITHWHVATDTGITFYAFLRDVSERRARDEELVRRRAREAELTHATLHDHLTGLANRTLTLERLTQALARRVQHGGELAVLFVDLDRFKLINDSMGHDAGDELLRAVAHRLTASVRVADSVARVAGDEFVVVCDDLDDRGEAMTIAHRILDALQAPVELSGERVRVRGSIGIAFAEAAGADTAFEVVAENLLRDADAAMYRAKELGRNQVSVFDADMRRRLRNELLLEREIAECLARDELRVWYRPHVELRSGRLTGMQPMTVWDHPRLGVLEPVSFTPIAEEIGAMPAILDWVLHEICEQYVRWQRAGAGELIFDVDLTARQIAHPGFLPSLTSALQRSGVPGQALAVCLLPPPGQPHDHEVLLTALDGMRSQGVAVGINGCGVDSAVLSWLAEVPFDLLKIAPQFGTALGVRPHADAVVSALVAMGEDMSMKVCIDGLLTAAQRDRAAALRCELGQGALFGGWAPPQERVPELSRP